MNFHKTIHNVLLVTIAVGVIAALIPTLRSPRVVTQPPASRTILVAGK